MSSRTDFEVVFIIYLGDFILQFCCARLTSKQSPSEGRVVSEKMLGHKLRTHDKLFEGLPVDKLYVGESMSIDRAFKLAIRMDRLRACPVLEVSEILGIEVTEMMIRRHKPSAQIALDYDKGVTLGIAHILGERFGLHDKLQNLTLLLQKVFQAFKESDATTIEIDPLVCEKDTGRFVCGSSKVSIDDAAQNRQPELFSLKDRSQDQSVDSEAREHGMEYIQLNGNIGCITSGAGLAMATNDAVSHYGGHCASFLDGGGQATEQTLIKAFELTLRGEKVTTVLVNVYGGMKIVMKVPFR